MIITGNHSLSKILCFVKPKHQIENLLQLRWQQNKNVRFSHQWLQVVGHPCSTGHPQSLASRYVNQPYVEHNRDPLFILVTSEQYQLQLLPKPRLKSYLSIFVFTLTRYSRGGATEGRSLYCCECNRATVPYFKFGLFVPIMPWCIRKTEMTFTFGSFCRIQCDKKKTAKKFGPSVIDSCISAWKFPLRHRQRSQHISSFSRRSASFFT